MPSTTWDIEGRKSEYKIRHEIYVLLREQETEKLILSGGDRLWK